MGRGHILLSNFTGGEVSPRIYARPGVAQVANGVKTAENALIALQGGAYKRPGSRFVLQLPDTDRHRFIKFQFSTVQSYMLVLRDLEMWIFKDQGVLTDTPVTITAATNADPCVITTSSAHGISNGSWVYISGVEGMEELNNRVFYVDNVTSTTMQLNDVDQNDVDATGYGAFSSGGTVGELITVTTPWTWYDLDRVQVTQINNVMYMSHPDYAVRKLTRVTELNWTLAAVTPVTGPFRDINVDDTLTITPSSFSASNTQWNTYEEGVTCTLTAANDVFDAGMVGGYFRLFEPGGFTGINEPRLGDPDYKINASNVVYSYRGFVYGIDNNTAGSWDAFTRVPEHESGVVRVFGIEPSGSRVRFDSTFLHPGFCIVKITAFTSATVVSAEIVKHHMPKSIVDFGTYFWEEGAWSDYRGYPGAITRFEQRLFLSGAEAQPATVWGSRSGIFEDFEDGADDDDAVTYTLAAESGDIVRWIAGRRALIAGTSGGEFVIAPSSENEALTPTNFKAVQQDDVGSSSVLPIYVGQSVMFPEREGNPTNLSTRLRQYAYEFSRDQFTATDITVFAEHIFGDGIRSLAFARTPEELVWVLRDDGALAACTFKPDQEVLPWHRHILGGDGTQAIKEIEVKPGANGDELWMQVNRTIDGTEVAYVEVLTKEFQENRDAKADGVFVDCSLTYDGSETSTISGLWHLRGEDVYWLADGVVYTGTVSDAGKVTLENPASKVHIGYNYTYTIELQELEAFAQNGTAQSRPQRVSEVRVRVLQSAGGKVGTDTNYMKDMVYRTESMAMDTSPDLKDGYVRVHPRSGWGDELSIRIEQSEPLPFFVTGVVADLSTSG